jgi:hypothetical protein
MTGRDSKDLRGSLTANHRLISVKHVWGLAKRQNPFLSTLVFEANLAVESLTAGTASALRTAQQ